MQHCLERALERYGVHLTNYDLGEITKLCLNGCATRLFVRDSFGRIKKHKLNSKQGLYRVIYQNHTFDIALRRDKAKSGYCIATFLPKPVDTTSIIRDCRTFRELKEILSA